VPVGRTDAVGELLHTFEPEQPPRRPLAELDGNPDGDQAVE